MGATFPYAIALRRGGGAKVNIGVSDLAPSQHQVRRSAARPTVVATNKCLAGSNKSRAVGKSTKNTRHGCADRALCAQGCKFGDTSRAIAHAKVNDLNRLQRGRLTG